MDFEYILAIGVIILYSLGTFGMLLGTLALHRPLKALADRITLAGFSLHTVVAVAMLASNGFTALPMGYYPQLMAWSLIFLYICAWGWLRLPFLGLTAAPLALLLYILSMRLSYTPALLPEHLSGLFFTLHIWSLYLSLGLLAMAFGAGVLFVYMESRLKKKLPMAEFTRDLPSLAACDKVNHIAVTAGFPLYTLGLMSGFIWAPMAKTIVENPKVLLSLVVWLLYALFFYQRTALRYRGKKTAVMAIVIFGISVLSFGIDYAISHHSTQMFP
ncbi:MAG: cytochrome c biogenesis protein [Desulfovibrio sp.]|jgi:ABC-type uncharacterized transport system permease subunit|nr:cytochrome c biogenesis protein [Desulfovibrio sp.]